MQPYFFPWLGYFSLIKHTDQFILFDPVQFIRHGWIERNRILKQDEGWLYIKVPLVKHSLQTLIKDVVIDDSQPWRQRLLAQLVTYKKLSKRYNEIYGLIEAAIAPQFTSIVELNRHALQAVCRYLGFDTALPIWSQMDMKVDPHSHQMNGHSTPAKLLVTWMNIGTLQVVRVSLTVPSTSVRASSCVSINSPCDHTISVEKRSNLGFRLLM